MIYLNNNYASFFNWLVKESKIKSIIISFNNIDYDRNFHYSESKDIFTADSSTNPKQSLTCPGLILAQHIANNTITIIIK